MSESSSSECVITRRNVLHPHSNSTTPAVAPPQDGGLPPKRQPVCLLRPFKPQDELAVKQIISDATMETVGEFFWAAVLSEIFPQVAFTTIAIGFVGLGLPFYFCLSLVPAAIVLMYAVIWSAHMFKVLELHSDLSNITNTYQQEKCTGFWVAEVYDSVRSSELAAHLNITKKVIYDFVEQSTLDQRGDNLASFKQCCVVACVALTRSNVSPNKAWLRRFAVLQDYQRRSIASNLLEFVIQFCKKQQYKGIELLTTDCHHKARAMYLKAGFSVTMNTRYFLNVAQPTYLFTMSLLRNDDNDELEEEKKGHDFV